MSRRGKYDNEFKVQALKLKKEVGLEEAATQLGINRETLKYWDRSVRNGSLKLENSDISPDGASRYQRGRINCLESELEPLRSKIKGLLKEMIF